MLMHLAAQGFKITRAYLQSGYIRLEVGSVHEIKNLKTTNT